MSRIFLISVLLLTQVFALANSTIKSQLDDATEQAKRLVANAVVDTAKHYCLKGMMGCRSIFTYKTKSGIKLKHMSQVFMSSERQVGSAAYFFPDRTKPGYYVRYEDMNFDGKIGITEILDSILVERKDDGTYMKMVGLRLVTLGTSMYSLADLTFDEEKAVLEGIRYDSNNPSYKEPVHIEYYRVYP